jgi:hypothetical protein
MRRTLMTLAVGAAAVAAGAIFPAAAQAATVSVVPAPAGSLFVAGYEQLGCHHNAYPQYTAVRGEIVVPVATAIHGAAGLSYDVYSIGGINSGVVGGVEVANANGQAYYTAYAQWGFGAQVTAFSVNPGDKLIVTIVDQGSTGWTVEIEDGGQEFFQTNPDTNASPCVAGAYEQNDYPTYDHLTQTTPVAFDFSQVGWVMQGQPISTTSKLLAAPPAYARLSRYNMVDSGGAVVAATSKPADSNNNFTITDK